MALNPIVFTEKVVRSFLRYQRPAGSQLEKRIGTSTLNTCAMVMPLDRS